MTTHNTVFATIREASRRTGLSTYYLRLGCRTGKFPYIRTGEGSNGIYMINMPLLMRILDGESVAVIKEQVEGNVLHIQIDRSVAEG